MARGAVFYPIPGLRDGRDGDGVLIGPPFIITEAQADTAFGIFTEALAEVEGR